VPEPTSPAGHNNALPSLARDPHPNPPPLAAERRKGRRERVRVGQSGFTLLEVVCVLAILALVAAILLPALPHGTSRPRLQSYALAVAALLKADRNAAVRRGEAVATRIDAAARVVRSGATGRAVKVPDDVVVDALISARCGQDAGAPNIRFFSSGMSCGGVIALTNPGMSYQIRINWLTGAIDVVSPAHS
jgi:general secretion pathway protein H